MDLFLSSVGLILFAIPMVWIAWRIHRESQSSPFFHQIRIGYQGQPFTITKFRTMSEEGQILSPFSQQLRDTAMDELPQLIQIFRGEMSFVGPRPLIPEELEDLRRIEQGQRRLEVRPGLTGFAQLYSEKIPPLAERVRWDVQYVNKCSFPLDVRLIARSVLVTLRGAWERHSTKGPVENS